VDIPTNFILIIIFFNEPFEYGDGGIFKLLRWMQNLHHLTWDHEILYADKTSTELTTFIKTTFAIIQKM
jgi:hypothetical protein